MSKTLANLRTGVRVYLDEAAQTDWLDTEVDRAINYAYQEIAGKVMEIYEEFYNQVTQHQYSTLVGIQEYTIDANILKVERVEINYNPSNTNVFPIRAQAIKMAELPQNLGNTSIGGTGLFNAGYYLYGSQHQQKLGFVPIPQIAATNNITVWSIDAPSDLSAPTDAVLIPYPDRFGALIEMGAAAVLLRKGQQEEATAKEYLSNYKLGIVEMQAFLKERQSDGPWMIEDADHEDINFDIPLSGAY